VTEDNESEKKKSKALYAYGEAFSERPFNNDIINSTREDVRAAGGNELVLEASYIIGAYCLMTKVVDATGRKSVGNMEEFTSNILKKIQEKAIA